MLEQNVAMQSSHNKLYFSVSNARLSLRKKDRTKRRLWCKIIYNEEDLFDHENTIDIM